MGIEVSVFAVHLHGILQPGESRHHQHLFAFKSSDEEHLGFSGIIPMLLTNEWSLGFLSLLSIFTGYGSWESYGTTNTCLHSNEMIR